MWERKFKEKGDTRRVQRLATSKKSERYIVVVSSRKRTGSTTGGHRKRESQQKGCEGERKQEEEVGVKPEIAFAYNKGTVESSTTSIRHEQPAGKR